MTNNKRLVEVWPTFAADGIFQQLEDDYTTPWEEEIDGDVLDMAYYAGHSGEKITSPLLDVLLTANNTDKVNATIAATLSKIINAKYMKNWERLWELNVAEYNPLENYNRTEDETITHDQTETVNMTHTTDVTRTDNLAHTDGRTLDSNVTTNEVYGFNSTDPKPESKSTNVHTWSDGGSNTGTVRNAGSEGDSGTKRDAGTTTKESTISGNIGVTTSQQMAQSEIDLWQWHYFETIFNDIDRELTCNMYNLSL